MSFEPHQQLIVDEKKELDEKIHKLTVFLASAASAQVSVVEVRLMHEQLNHMLQYSKCLQLRIRAFGA
jgi:hypothetical protein